MRFRNSWIVKTLGMGLSDLGTKSSAVSVKCGI